LFFYLHKTEIETMELSQTQQRTHKTGIRQKDM